MQNPNMVIYQMTSSTYLCSFFNMHYKHFMFLIFILFISGCQSHYNEIERHLSHSKSGEQHLTTKESKAVYVNYDAYSNLWDRARQNLAMNLNHDNAQIQTELAYYQQHQVYFDKIVTRATPYLYFIVTEAEKRKIPMEIALLPFVESAFDVFAYSHGRAAGLWQFIPSTGKYFGLKQNWWYDGRRDVVASTTAAMDYLESLHQQFKDWELALAAYNAGRGTVSLAIRKNQKKQIATDFWSLSLPVETKKYVPKLIAIAKIIQRPSHYNITLKPVANKPYFEIVDTQDQIDMLKAATLAGIDIQDLYRLNPGFNRWATDPDGPHKLIIPIEKADMFRNSLKALPPENRIKWQTYSVKSGDNLATIANQFKASVKLIKAANNLQSDIIRIGAPLLIPVPSANIEIYSLNQEQRRITRQNKAIKGRQKYIHLVKKNDNLWTLSKNYGVSVSSLARWNSMSPKDLLTPGRTLTIWTPHTKTASTGIIRKVNYNVRSGDNLSSIANHFNVLVKQIRDWNIIKGKYLQPGQKITLYVDVTNSH